MAKEIEITIKEKKKRKRTTAPSSEKDDEAKKGSSTRTRTPKADDDEGETPAFLKSVAWQAGKQMLSAGMSQYANLTGDYVMAQKMNQVSQAVSFSMQLLTGDYIGAAITTISTLANVGINYVRNEKEVELLRRRAGVFTNGGRDTNE
jgi:hypothetical protein